MVVHLSGVYVYVFYLRVFVKNDGGRSCMYQFTGGEERDEFSLQVWVCK